MSLIPSVSIEKMLLQRSAVIERLTEAHRLLCEAAVLAGEAHLGDLSDLLVLESKYSNHMPSQHRLLECGVESLIRVLDINGWRYLMNESGIRSFMDSSAREQWEDQLRKGVVVPLDRNAIESTFNSLYAQREEMLERGVIQLFKNLSWDHKTNQPFKFGKKVIINYFSSTMCGKSLYIRSEATNKLDDLMRVFCKLCNRPEPDHRHAMSYLIGNQERSGQRFFQNDFFSVRWFKKGTAHIVFLQKYLIDKLNDILSKHYPFALPNACL